MSQERVQSTVGGLFIGKARNLWPGKGPSGIMKEAISGPIDICRTGLVGDEQADRKHHGGLDKAIHHYPAEHYPKWCTELGGSTGDFCPGRFGENISTLAVDEASLCIGDTLRIGNALVQVTQGRQPCWKLNLHTGRKNMASLMQASLRTGWYYRVLEEGRVQLGDVLHLIHRPSPGWTVEKVTAARFDAELLPDTAGAISEIEGLCKGWRNVFERKAERKHRENQNARLFGA